MNVEMCMVSLGNKKPLKWGVRGSGGQGNNFDNSEET